MTKLHQLVLAELNHLAADNKFETIKTELKKLKEAGNITHIHHTRLLGYDGGYSPVEKEGRITRYDGSEMKPERLASLLEEIRNPEAGNDTGFLNISITGNADFGLLDEDKELLAEITGELEIQIIFDPVEKEWELSLFNEKEFDTDEMVTISGTENLILLLQRIYGVMNYGKPASIVNGHLSHWTGGFEVV